MGNKRKTIQIIFFAKAKIFISVVALFSMGIVSSYGQQIVHRVTVFTPGLGVSVSTGPSVSFTDIKKNMVFPSSNPKNEWNLTYLAALDFELSPIWLVRGQVGYSHIMGARPSRDAFFMAKLLEMNLSVAINPLLLFQPYYNEQKWHSEIIVGIGLTHYNSYLKTISTDSTLAKRGYGKGGGIGGYVIEGVALGGFAIKYKLNNKWSIRFETTNKWMDSDRLDTIESVDSSPYDFYNFTTLGFTYKIFKSTNYPMVNKRK